MERFYLEQEAEIFEDSQEGEKVHEDVSQSLEIKTDVSNQTHGLELLEPKDANNRELTTPKEREIDYIPTDKELAVAEGVCLQDPVKAYLKDIARFPLLNRELV